VAAWFTPFFVSAGASFFVLLLLLRPQAASKVTSRRLAGIRKSIGSNVLSIDGTELEKDDPWGYMESLEGILERYRPGKAIKTVLLHANSNLSLSGFFLASAASAIAVGLLGGIFSRILWVAAVCSLVGGILPTIVLRVKRNRRVKAFNAALPDAIDLMARCLVAGHSIGSSIDMIGQQSPEPLAFEFVQVYQQQRLGLQFREALLQMGGRVPSRDLQFLITAILVQKETGGDLTEILSRTSHVIRERIRIEGEVRTRTAQGRLTGWILGLLPVVMLVLINIISPGYSHVLFHDPIGQDLMIAGATLIAIGAFVIRRIVDIQV
jgi:tight adherence protein B